ncbi:hypothetical protein NL53_05015 [Vibrio variabilis]|uniref:Probable lipid II flippase MurJ n=1 Tax=Vibrio variabilis TaxID=990271 RepID=A0ABR4YDX1_9VIBR|nr:murein biosynthesis integral membrane protein MurJ [Vibrio variabilis]KHA61679.1 hypothetical protein NL53_05015 [Vibrio variabilis]
MSNGVIFLLLVTLLTKIVGFGREIILSSHFGTSVFSDAYLVALTITSIVTAIIGLGLATTYIPIVNGLNCTTSDSINKFTSKFINFIFILVLSIILVYFFSPRFFISIFAYGFSPQQFDYAIDLTNIMIWSMLFSGAVSILTGFLQNSGRFNLASISSLPLNVVVITSIIIAYHFDYIYLAYGFLIGAIFQFLLILFLSKRSGFKYFMLNPIRDPHIKRAILLAVPIVFGVSVSQVNVIVDKTIASSFSPGSISSLNYAFMITSVIHSVIVMSLVSVSFPAISKLAKHKDFTRIQDINFSITKLIVIIIFPISSFFVIFSEEIIKIVYFRGSFDYESVLTTSSAFLFYSFGLLAIAIREVIIRVFYSFGDTKTPLYNSIICMVLNVLLSFTLSKFLGLGGIALASSISVLFACLFLWFVHNHKYGSFIDVNKVSFLIFKVILATSLTYFVFVYTNDFIIVYTEHYFAGSLVVSSLFYILTCFVTKTLRSDDLNLSKYKPQL